MLVIPRRDCTSGTISGMLFLLGSTLLGYSAENLLVLLGAWILTTVPFFSAHWFAPPRGVRAWLCCHRASRWRLRSGIVYASGHDNVD